MLYAIIGTNITRSVIFMKKLFLVAFFKDVASKLAAFEKNLVGKTITFIPTACKVDKVTFHIAEGKAELEKLGLIIDELDISIAPASEISSKLKRNDFIYVAGGNTFYLLQELQKTGADKIIIDEVNAGKLYIGESAGAMIVSANIEYVKLMDNIKKAPELQSLTALNLLDFYVVPHYNNPPFEECTQKMLDCYSQNLNLIPISNNELIMVADTSVKIERV